MTGPGPGRGSRIRHPLFEAGNTTALRHGARSKRVVLPLAQQLATELAEVAPWTASPAFASLLAAWSYEEARCQLLRNWISEHSLLSDAGQQATTDLDKATTAAANFRRDLCTTPASMARLLVSLASASSPVGDDDGLAALRAEGQRIIEARMPALDSSYDDDPSLDAVDDDQPDDDHDTDQDGER